MSPLPLRADFLFRLALEVGPPQMQAGALRVVPVTGGRFDGPGLRGHVVPGTSADWLRVEADGTAHMDVRLVLRTEAGEELFMQYSGIRHGPPEVLARLGRGEAVDAAEYYFRIAIRFETAAPGLLHLNRALAVGVGQRPPAGPTYDVHLVL